MLSKARPTAPPFQKVCGNSHVANLITCSTCDVHYNAYHSKSKIHKSSFLQDSIVTNDGTILLTIEGKWLEAIVHMTKFEFLNLNLSKTSSTPRFNSCLW